MDWLVDEVFPCPCGKGTIEEGFWEDDWCHRRYGRKVLCPVCEARGVE